MARCRLPAELRLGCIEWSTIELEIYLGPNYPDSPILGDAGTRIDKIILNVTSQLISLHSFLLVQSRLLPGSWLLRPLLL